MTKMHYNRGEEREDEDSRENIIDVTSQENTEESSTKSNQPFNFDMFKRRNKDLKTKENDKNKTTDILDKKALAKLEELIKEDETSNTEYKQINYRVDSKTEEENYDPEYFNNVLVHRPTRNFVWGLGQQTKQKKCKKNILIFS